MCDCAAAGNGAGSGKYQRTSGPLKQAYRPRTAWACYRQHETCDDRSHRERLSRRAIRVPGVRRFGDARGGSSDCCRVDIDCLHDSEPGYALLSILASEGIRHRGSLNDSDQVV